MVGRPKQEDSLTDRLSVDYADLRRVGEHTHWRDRETYRPKLLQGLNRRSPHV